MTQRVKMRDFESVAKQLMRARKYKLGQYLKRLVTETLQLLAESSPQYSGLFAASWRVRAVQDSGKVSAAFDDFSSNVAEEQFKPRYAGDGDAPNYGYRYGGYIDLFSGQRSKWMGDQEAVDFTMRVNQPFIAKLSVRSANIEFYNLVPYAEYIAQNVNEEGKVNYLRAGNYRDPRPIPLGYAKAAIRSRI